MQKNKPDTKEQILDNSIHMWYLEESNQTYRDKKQNSGFQGIAEKWKLRKF